MVRRCYICGENLAVEDFALDGSKSGGRKSICLACDRERSASYYAQNREAKLAQANARNARLRQGRAGR
jgi:hypothetical protein